MNIRDALVGLVESSDNEDLQTVHAVWTVLDRQQVAASRSNLSYRALDAVEAMDRGDVEEARMVLTKSLGDLWPHCENDEIYEFCPLCASVQSAMFVDGVAIEVEHVHPHLLLLKNKDAQTATKVMSMINEYWAANESPEDGFTNIVEGPGFLAFVEMV
jgi:hypothetical protein